MRPRDLFFFLRFWGVPLFQNRTWEGSTRLTLDASELPDEMDLASSEYMQSFTFRLRGRERVFLQKIEKAIKKLDEGVFGVCDDCEEPISIKRLEARPETELCIRCKEDQERMERDFA